MEETAGDGRRGAISGEICCSKGEMVGEDGIVFVVGKERESEEKDTKVMSVMNKDGAIFCYCNDEQIKAIAFVCVVVSLFLSTDQSAICVVMILSLYKETFSINSIQLKFMKFVSLF